jgi:uncharacterized Zn-binding protein involved in type VI secretion
MGQPAARLTDMHVCPMVTPGLPPIPHVGGPVTGPGCPTVLIGGMPASVMGDMCVCVGPPDTIIMGSTGVFIGGMPAARMGDPTTHGGTIVLGCPTVLIGEVGSGSADPVQLAMLESASNMSSAFATKASRIVALQTAANEGTPEAHKHNIEDSYIQYEVVDDDDNPVSDLDYEIELSDGKIVKGTTDSNGLTKKISGYTQGMSSISFPDTD